MCDRTMCVLRIRKSDTIVPHKKLYFSHSTQSLLLDCFLLFVPVRRLALRADRRIFLASRNPLVKAASALVTFNLKLYFWHIYLVRLFPYTHYAVTLCVYTLLGYTLLSNMNAVQQVKQNTWMVESQTGTGRRYIVEKQADGSLTCTCPDFQYRDRECKHILVSGAM